MSDFELREQDRWLPIANVDRVMRKALPNNAKISKEAKECMQECVSEFISFITSQSAERCSIDSRKTLNGEDILFSLNSLGFENYAEILRIYLTKYRIFELDEVEKRRRKYLDRKKKLQLQKQELKNQQNTYVNITDTANTTITNASNNNRIMSKPNILTFNGLLNNDNDNDNDNETNDTNNNQFMNDTEFWNLNAASNSDHSMSDSKEDLLNRIMENV